MRIQSLTHWFTETRNALLRKTAGLLLRDYRGPTWGAWIYADGTTRVYDFALARGEEICDAHTSAVACALGRGDAQSKTWSAEARSRYGKVLTTGDGLTLEEAARLIMESYRIEEENLVKLEADPARKLEYELLRFDWDAQYSDAPGVCSASDHHWKTVIQPLLETVPPDQARDIWYRAAPDRMRQSFPQEKV